MYAEIIVDSSNEWCNFAEELPIPFAYYQHMDGMVYIADRNNCLINIRGGMYSGLGFRHTTGAVPETARKDFRRVELAKAYFKVKP